MWASFHAPTWNYTDPGKLFRSRSQESLSHEERFVFILQDFDNLMEMEGWEHFFLYDNHFKWYAEMKKWLHAIDDHDSLAVLRDYESSLKARGVALSPSEIEQAGDNEQHSVACATWCSRYCELRGARWAKAVAYFKRQGIHLQT